MKTETGAKRFLGVKDIQKIFGIGRGKAVALMNKKGFPAIKLGRTYRVDSEKLEEWIDMEIKEQSVSSESSGTLEEKVVMK